MSNTFEKVEVMGNTKGVIGNRYDFQHRIRNTPLFQLFACHITFQLHVLRARAFFFVMIMNRGLVMKYVHVTYQANVGRPLYSPIELFFRKTE